MFRLVTFKDAIKNDSFTEFGVCRYKFCEKLNWKQGLYFYETTLNGKKVSCEKDKYDMSDDKNPGPFYAVSYDELGISAFTRFQSTEYDYMLQEFKNIYPRLVDFELPSSSDALEATRTIICNDKPAVVREIIRTKRELVIAFFEIGLQLNVNRIFGTMAEDIVNTLFRRAGCTSDDICYTVKPMDIYDSLSNVVCKNNVAGWINISEDGYKRVIEKNNNLITKYGIDGSLLYILESDKNTQEKFPLITVSSEIVRGNNLSNTR